MKKENFEIPLKCTGIAVVLLKKIDNDYKVLLLKRATPILRNVWCYIGGSVEEGEKAWEAALREIEEETGITKVSLYISNKFDQIYSPYEEYIYIAPVFVGYVDDGQVVTLNNEHREYKWLTIDEAINQVTLPGNDEVLWAVERHFIKRKPLEYLRIGN